MRNRFLMPPQVEKAGSQILFGFEDEFGVPEALRDANVLLPHRKRLAELPAYQCERQDAAEGRQILGTIVSVADRVHGRAERQERLRADAQPRVRVSATATSV